MNLNDLQNKIHQTAVEHGWWEPQMTRVTQNAAGEQLEEGSYSVPTQRTFGELLALVHSEVSEALEAYRENGLKEWFEKVDGSGKASYTAVEGYKPEGAFTELGDAIIRILDMAGFYGVDMQEIIERKMAYNETRSFRHGGKKL